MLYWLYLLLLIPLSHFEFLQKHKLMSRCTVCGSWCRLWQRVCGRDCDCRQIDILSAGRKRGVRTGRNTLIEEVTKGACALGLRSDHT